MWTKEKIHELLDSNPMAVMKALVVIYDRQSETEKNNQVTTLANGVGFSAFDAKFCSSLAERIKKTSSPNARQFCHRVSWQSPETR